MTKQSSSSAASSPLTQTLAAIAVGVIIWVALSQSETGGLDLGTFASYVVALLTLLERIKSLSGINAAIQRGLAAAESIFGLLDRDVEPDDRHRQARARAAASCASIGSRCAIPARSARR